VGVVKALERLTAGKVAAIHSALQSLKARGHAQHLFAAPVMTPAAGTDI